MKTYAKKCLPFYALILICLSTINIAGQSVDTVWRVDGDEDRNVDFLAKSYMTLASLRGTQAFDSSFSKLSYKTRKNIITECNILANEVDDPPGRNYVKLCEVIPWYCISYLLIKHDPVSNCTYLGAAILETDHESKFAGYTFLFWIKISP